MKLKRINNSKGEFHAWAIYCPGCGWPHLFDVRWQFNGDHEQPTFTPSIRVTAPDKKECHLVLTKGVIHYQGDTTQHTLRGEVPLPEYPEELP